MTPEEIYRKAIEKWGNPLQIQMAVEEMSELIKQLIKHLRGKVNSEKIDEEMADVEIMLDQLKVMFNNQRLVESQKKEKLYRLEKLLVKS